MLEPPCVCRACRDGRPAAEQDLMTVTAGRPATAVVVVRAIGDVDLLTAPRWERALRDGVDRLAPGRVRVADIVAGTAGPAKPPELVVDLDGVELLGAAAVSVLVAVDAVARAEGVLLVVVATRRQVRRVLELTGVGLRLHRRGRLGESRAAAPRAPAPPGSHRTTGGGT